MINMKVSSSDLLDNARDRYGELDCVGPSLCYRLECNYYTPDEWYESLVNKLVNTETEWLDVGCGRDLFPGNDNLSSELSARCERLVGVDPDANVLENRYVHERVHATLDDYSSTDVKFDLITFRMVVEHIDDPHMFWKALNNLLKPNGVAVVYTVSGWSLTSIVSRFTPMWFHHFLKSRIWNTEEKDTFPVFYNANSKKTLNRLFTEIGCENLCFVCLPDVVFWKYPYLHLIEIKLIQLLQRLRLHHLDNCLLAVYAKADIHINEL